MSLNLQGYKSRQFKNILCLVHKIPTPLDTLERTCWIWDDQVTFQNRSCLISSIRSITVRIVKLEKIWSVYSEYLVIIWWAVAILQAIQTRYE